MLSQLPTFHLTDFSPLVLIWMCCSGQELLGQGSLIQRSLMNIISPYYQLLCNRFQVPWVGLDNIAHNIAEDVEYAGIDMLNTVCFY